MSIDDPSVKAAVTAAVDEIGAMLRADGADLLLLEVDGAADRIRLQLVLDDASCAECVLPPAELHQTIEMAVQRRVPGEFELLLDDPRA